MTELQYNLVKTFLSMGSKPRTIASSFKEKLAEIEAVERSYNYEQYLKGGGDLLEMLRNYSR